MRSCLKLLLPRDLLYEPATLLFAEAEPEVDLGVLDPENMVKSGSLHYVVLCACQQHTCF
jgi:hypothetical protein